MRRIKSGNRPEAKLFRPISRVTSAFIGQEPFYLPPERSQENAVRRTRGGEPRAAHPQRAAELWPGIKPAQFPEAMDYRSPFVSPSEYKQTLAPQKCAHFRSLFNWDALAQAVLAEPRRRRLEHRRVQADGRDGPTVTDPELIEAVRRGIDCFMRNWFGSEHDSESCPPVA